jgi:hypothetical protein
MVMEKNLLVLEYIIKYIISNIIKELKLIT